MGGIHNHNHFKLFPGQGVKLGAAFGVVRQIRGGMAVVFFADGERMVPIHDLQRPVERGEHGEVADDPEDADVLNEDKELVEVEAD